MASWQIYIYIQEIDRSVSWSNGRFIGDVEAHFFQGCNGVELYGVYGAEFLMEHATDICVLDHAFF